MKIYFNKSLCKKCPYGHMTTCLYKKVFYSYVPPPYSNKKLIHKCEHYRNIFSNGQHVVIDLYHKVRGSDNRWEYILAHENVCGIIAGVQHSKYIIELFQPYFLQRKKGVEVHMRSYQPARMIRPFSYKEYNIHEENVPVEARETPMPAYN